MPSIALLVEGPGDIEAAPLLVRRVLHERYRAYDWEITRPIKVHNYSTLIKRLPNFIHYLDYKNNCDAILIILDLDDGCPMDQVQELKTILSTMYFQKPIEIVFAHKEFETWFLSSIETISGNYNIAENLIFRGDVEALRGVKEWFTRNMPPGKCYKETVHQARMAQKIDLALAYDRSRSFRRLCNAIAQIIKT